MLKNLVKEEDFNSFLLNNQDKLILVKFFTVWCAPCQELQKNIEELLVKKKDLLVLGVDAEKFPGLTRRSEFNIYSVPTIFLFQKGKIIKKSSGNMSVNQLREFTDV